MFQASMVSAAVNFPIFEFEDGTFSSELFGVELVLTS